MTQLLDRKQATATEAPSQAPEKKERRTGLIAGVTTVAIVVAGAIVAMALLGGTTERPEIRDGWNPPGPEFSASATGATAPRTATDPSQFPGLSTGMGTAYQVWLDSPSDGPQAVEQFDPYEQAFIDGVQGSGQAETPAVTSQPDPAEAEFLAKNGQGR